MGKFMAVVVTAILAAGFITGQDKKQRSESIPCDRGCLEGLAGQYLDAMVAHNPAKAPFARNVKHTENTAPLPFSEGLWFTSTALGDYKFFIADPQSGQMAYVGMVKEGDKTYSHLTVRLKVENRQIAEVETIVVRNLNERNLRYLNTPPPAFSEALAPQERRSREELVKISNLYFDGIERLSNEIAPWDPECYRIENGMWTAGLELPKAITSLLKEPEPAPAAAAGGPPQFRRTSCSNGFDSGGLGYITSITPRRVPVVDLERGVTWGVYRFNHRGVRTLKMKDGSTRPAPFADEPNSMPIAEIFKIKNGKIRDIMALMVRVPYGAPTGW